jgi:hypothetical protein
MGATAQWAGLIRPQAVAEATCREQTERFETLQLWNDGRRANCLNVRARLSDHAEVQPHVLSNTSRWHAQWLAHCCSCFFSCGTMHAYVSRLAKG